VLVTRGEQYTREEHEEGGEHDLKTSNSHVRRQITGSSRRLLSAPCVDAKPEVGWRETSAASQVPAIRADGVTTAGACREWMSIESAGTRRASARVRPKDDFPACEAEAW